MLHSVNRPGTNVQFTYDHSGLRVRKCVNGVDTRYTLNGKHITHIQIGADTYLHIFYDARVVEYLYDAWGKPLGTTGPLAQTLGKANPFRYRGYVWDEEIGLYVTATRYYSPEWGRFLNADALLGSAGALLSQNVFAYCVNNPVKLCDPEGTSPLSVLLLVVGAIAWGLQTKKKRDNYRNTVLALDVENTKRYQKYKENGEWVTFCNRFAYDVMGKMGAMLPSLNGKGEKAGYVREMYGGLTQSGGFVTDAGRWVEMTGPFALGRAWLGAQLGAPTISIWRSKDSAARGGQGHIQVCYPGNGFDTSWAQAGGKNYSAGQHMSRQDPETHAGKYGGTYRYYYFQFD